jgi:hypothetical protein
MLSYRLSTLIVASLLFGSTVSHAQPAPPASKPQPAPKEVLDPNDPLNFSAPPKPEQVANDKRAKELYTQADGAYAEGKYAMALVLFRESYALSNRPLILIAMANSQERLGDLQGALDNLNTYARQTDISKEPTIGQRILSLESRIKDSAAKEAAAKAEQDQLQREQQAAKPEPLVPGPVQNEPELEPRTPRLPWILIGTGSAVVLAGASFALVARSARNSADSLCDDTSGKTLCMTGAQKYLDRDSTFSLLADISIGVGVATAATGLVFLLLPKDEDAGSTPNFAVGPNSMSVTMQGSF